MTDARHRPTDLRRSLAAIRRTQSAWLADLAAIDGVIAGAVLDRWQEQLVLLHLHLVRAERRLADYLAAPAGQRPQPRDLAVTDGFLSAYRRWDGFLTDRLHRSGLPCSYQRLRAVLDPDEEAIVADIGGDLAQVAAVAESTAPALERVDAVPEELLEDLAFRHVLAPWRTRGGPALRQVLRWLDECREEHSWL